MYSIIVVILHVFIVAQAHATDMDMLADKLVNELVDKLVTFLPAPPSLPFHGAMRRSPDVWAVPGSFTRMNPQSRSSRIRPKAIAPYREWRDGAAQSKLLSRGLQLVTCQRAFKMLKDKDNAILLDVRPNLAGIEMIMPDGMPGGIRMGRPEGAVSVPILRKLSGNKPEDIVKRMMTGALLGKPATEHNPDFSQQMTTITQSELNPTVIVACNQGGNLNFVKGDPASYTQSLQAAYELYEAGFTNVRLLEGGIPRWQEDGLPMSIAAMRLDGLPTSTDNNENDPRPS